jgi:hypothetical protein
MGDLGSLDARKRLQSREGKAYDPEKKGVAGVEFVGYWSGVTR